MDGLGSPRPTTNFAHVNRNFSRQPSMVARRRSTTIKREEQTSIMPGRVAAPKYSVKPITHMAMLKHTSTVFGDDRDQVMPDARPLQTFKDQSTYDEGYQTGDCYPTPPGQDSQRSNAANKFWVQSEGTGQDILVRGPRELLKAINYLAQDGLERCNLPLPKIVVVGDQSAGKSSLIEAISEITVPRASGVCTRCPLQINLVTGESWSCTVAIHRKYTYVKGFKPENQNDYPSWQFKEQPNDEASIDIHSKTEIEAVLRRAQEAILCPTKNAHDILKGHVKAVDLLPFSPDVIRLEICGPTLPTLTIYDLPGIINQVEDENEDLPDLVRSLAREYIRPENTIVMLACPMSVDPATSSAADLVRKCKAQDRCIGVLTKPDTIHEAEVLDQWIDILKGKKFPLGYGYYAAKQPSPGELQQCIDHARAREIESNFFATHSPWKDQLAQFRPRCGTTLLQSRLSELLILETRKALPIIDEQITKRLDHVTAELSNYPKPPENCLAKVIGLTEKFRQGIDKVMVGEWPNNQLRTGWRELSVTYWQNMIDMKPVVVVSQTPEPFWNINPAAEPISLDSDDENDVRATPGRKRPASALPQTPDKRQRSNGPRSTTSSSRRNELAKKFKLDEIRQIIRDMSASSGVPSETDPRAEERLIKESVENWDKPLTLFLENTNDLLRTQIDLLVDGLLRPWEATALYVKVRDYVHRQVTEFMNQHKERSLRHLSAEQQKPCTLNDRLLKICRSDEEAILVPHRRNARAKYYLDMKEGTQWKHAPGPDREKKVAEREKKAAAVKDQDLGEDPFQAEMKVMSRIRGYYMLAMSTFVDTVCKTMDFEVFERCREELANGLTRVLGLEEDDATSRCQALLAEDDQRERMRASLEEEKQKLLTAKRHLEDVYVH